MNLKNYLIGAGVSAIILAGSVFKNGERIKVSVVHYSQGETTVMDTIFDAESGYSAQQFLIDNGLNPETTEIINTDAFDGKHILQNENSVLYMRKGNDWNLNEEKEFVIKHVSEVAVFSEDAVGEIEKITENIVGEEAIGDEEIEVIVEQIQGANEDVFFNNVSDGDTHLKIKNVNGEITVMLNGEKLEVEELLENENLTGLELKMIKKHLDEGEENQHTVYDLKTDNEGEARVIVIRNDVINGEMEDMKGTIVEVIASDIEEIMGELEHTIALVSTVSDEGGKEGFIAEPAYLPIEGPKYFPNPSKGKFRLEFFLPERGQTQIQIFDMTGRMVFGANLGNFQGKYNDNIDISGLESGHYIMHITQNNLRLAEKIIVN